MPREKSIAERFDAFVEAVGGRLYKPNRRFLRDAVFGLLEKRSTLLSEIGRALDEPHTLIQTEKRLSRGLASPRYDDAAVEEDYLKLALLVHDPRRQVERVAATFKAFGPVPTYLFYRLLEGIGRVLKAAMDGGP